MPRLHFRNPKFVKVKTGSQWDLLDPATRNMDSPGVEMGLR